MVSEFRKRPEYTKNYNLILFVSLILSGLGMGWLALNNVQAGLQYTIIFLIMSVLLLLGLFFIDEDNKKFQKNMLANPVSADYDIATFLYLLGWLAPILIKLVIVTMISATSFNVSALMIPLASGDIDDNITQSFSAVEASADPFWRWFVAVFTAGSIEEFGFGFVSMFIFYLGGIFILKMINDGEDLGFIPAK